MLGDRIRGEVVVSGLGAPLRKVRRREEPTCTKKWKKKGIKQA